MSIDVIWPVSIGPKTPRAASAPVARRTMPAHPVLGLIDNGKGRADAILDAIGRQLVQSGAFASHFVLRKRSAASPIDAKERAAMLARAHVIVSGIGD